MSDFTASDANEIERLGGTIRGGGFPAPPVGPAGGGLAGTYPNPTIAAGAVTEDGLSLSNVTTANVTSTAHGFAPRAPANAAQFLNGAATPGYAAVTDANLSLSDVTTNDVSTSKHGFAPKLPNDATKFLNGVGGYTAPPAATVTSVFSRTGAIVAASNDYTDAQVQNSPTNVLTTAGDTLYASSANTLARLAVGSAGQMLGITSGLPAWVSGGSRLLFSSILGGAQAAIDTGAAGIAGGFSVLEVFVMAQTTQAAALSLVNVTVNNDTGANYDNQKLQGNNATATAGVNLAQTAWAMTVHGASGTSGYPGIFVITIPAYAATTFNKVAFVATGAVDATAGNNEVIANMFGWRNTAAISRMAFTANSGNLAIGTSVFIFGR